MISTKEENLKVLFRTNEQLDESDFPEFDVNKREDGSYVSCNIYKDDLINDTIHKIKSISNDQKIIILLVKKYQIIIKDEDSGYEAIQRLLTPNFKTEEFCLSKCTFFIGEDDVYSVELDYDFKNALDVEINKFIEDENEVLQFKESAKSILENIIEGLEVFL